MYFDLSNFGHFLTHLASATGVFWAGDIVLWWRWFVWSLNEKDYVNDNSVQGMRGRCEREGGGEVWEREREKKWERTREREKKVGENERERKESLRKREGEKKVGDKGGEVIVRMKYILEKDREERKKERKGH